MDWEKYTGKKPTASFPDNVRWLTRTAPAQKVYPIPQKPSFDEVWETIAGEIDNTIPSCAPMTGETIMQCMRLAMRIMFETLTQDQNGV